MIRSARIKPFQAASLDALDGALYTSAIATIGYERRSRQIPEALGCSGLAIPFNDHQEIDFAANLDFFEKSNWEVREISESDFFVHADEWLRTLVAREEPVRVAADVSSMSRRRIADLVQSVFELPQSANLDIDFLYTPAEFADPDLDPDHEPQVISVVPVSEAFAGWWEDLDKPLHAIVSLGYERERAASALDVLEPSSTQIYVPKGNDPRYIDAVRSANGGLDEFPGVLPTRVEYPVTNPFSCFQGLEANVSRIAATDRVVLIPLGPKIFALVALVVGALQPTATQVIRVSPGVREDAHQRLSDGTVCGLTISLRPPPELPEAELEE